MGFVDDIELGIELRRCVFDSFAQVADVVDPAVAGRIDLNDVGSRIARNRETTCAFVARAVVHVWSKAIHRLREQPGGRRLPGAAWTAEEIGMRDAVELNGI